MSFRLVPKSVTLAVILRYFSEFGYLPGVLRKSSRSLSHLLMSSCTDILWLQVRFLRVFSLSCVYRHCNL